MTTLEVLKAARQKIANSKHWTRGKLARDKRSAPVSPWDTRACRWCAVGAIDAVDPLCRSAAYNELSSSLACFNDSHTHAEVIAMFDRAIAKLEAK